MESIEILAVVESVSNEKGIEEGIIFGALETAIATASLRHFHEDAEITVSIDRVSGEYSTHRHWIVSEETVEDFHKETHVTENDSKLSLGDTYSLDVDNVVFGRIEAQAARQVMMQRVREAERDTIVAMFTSQNNSLMNGTVKRVTRDNIIVDIGNDIEAVLPRDQLLPGEIYKIKDRMRAILQIKEIEGRGSQLMLSRSCPEMVTELFRIEVPEINEDIIEIRGIARDAGSRSKITVKTNDGRIDPVGACVGMRGSRVQSVSGELGNERIDIIIYDDNPAQMVINALAPAKVESIVMDEDSRSMELAVNEENLALAIGSRGQNIRLASRLVGWELNIISSNEAEAKERVIEAEFQAKLMDNLSINESEAESLIRGGFLNFDDIAYAEDSKLLAALKLEESRVEEIKAAAADAALMEAMGEITQEESNLESLTELGFSEEEVDILVSKALKSMDDIAELAVDELQDIIEISDKKAADIIMKARESWFN
ncbi:MAG: transcription termination factor NusA [SAR86 cluster bacterium]|jgi:N utilization substance protein A|nr:transcription termination/antitermination protein NusA [Pseudomonadota bacterium]MDA9835084.1 transcription termination factor NusA [Gammaproteobacteria bacterium]MDO7561820.1 transcription termination factor NusA [SAR86 cluster bacterium]MDA9917029.1 transcription termination factor NusA [Gammaproteobacteria bacterium]MDA9978754.1 transcription termination factor NusA [Gammaproteobacteria bacterium]